MTTPGTAAKERKTGGRHTARVQRGAEHPSALGARTAGLARPGDRAAHRHVRGRAGPADAEREARIEEMEARAIAEAERNAAEARIRELKAEHRRLRAG